MDPAAASIWQIMVRWDQALFEKINGDWSNPFFDAVMPFLRTSLNWAPLYLFVLVLVLQNFRTKGLWWILFFILTIALTDLSGTYIFKHNIERLRPCRDPEFASHVRMLLKNCAGGFSFISNHAANHFGMAAFFYVTFRPIAGRWARAGFFWAAAIAYSQVYVGVHYPLDVLAGGILGIILGFTTGYVFSKQYGITIFGNQPAA